VAKVQKITKEPIGDKQWVKVVFDNGTYWIPKLEDIAVIASLIGECEDEKYGFPRNNVKGAEMVYEYIYDVFLLGSAPETIRELNRKYKLPDGKNAIRQNFPQENCLSFGGQK
jgi:hypothetical protein